MRCLLCYTIKFPKRVLCAAAVCLRVVLCVFGGQNNRYMLLVLKIRINVWNFVNDRQKAKT